MADSTLAAIRKKIRFLTKSPSQQQLTDNSIDEYVNTFILYDLPEHIRLFELHSTFTFYCQPNIDSYVTDESIPVTDPLYNFQNLYITVNPPIYVAGYQAGYSQSREQFYREWPQVDSITQVGAGDGVTLTFTGFVANGNNQPGSPAGPILRNFVLMGSVDTNGFGLQLIDQPLTTMPNFGNLYVPGQPVPSTTLLDPNNNINYITGAFTLNFTTAPAVGQPINAQVYNYVASRPLSMLWYDNTFILRPVPDQPYQINMEVYKRPTQLLASNQSPQMEQWWQYLAYGAAIKVLQDRFDYDSVNLITPEFRVQQELVLRRTVVQNTTQRVATIYSQQSDMGSGWGNWNGYGQSGI
jgi:hypothetical protein